MLSHNNVIRDNICVALTRLAKQHTIPPFMCPKADFWMFYSFF
jgi:hypothetical protein